MCGPSTPVARYSYKLGRWRRRGELQPLDVISAQGTEAGGHVEGETARYSIRSRRENSEYWEKCDEDHSTRNDTDDAFIDRIRQLLY
jgi:hypothetical protein